MGLETREVIEEVEMDRDVEDDVERMIGRGGKDSMKLDDFSSVS